ncbi:MAG: fibronectin type III domain-containing protein [Candidatus Omnitrophica bacterium]|nr:fibronectin type III domain-containing protein [Candidatus Omnitrophota bacterium]
MKIKIKKRSKKSVFFMFYFFFVFFLSTTAFAATYYVDSSAANDSGNGSSANPKKYIYSGILLMSSGDTLIIKDGIYSNNNDRIRGMPNGTSGNYTTIKAENDFGVILQGLSVGTGLASEQAAVNLYNKSWVTIEGLIIKDCQGSGIYTLSAIQVTDSDHCRLRKLGIKNGVHSGAEYGGAISTSGTSYSLFEDIFICGMMRYGINVGGGSGNEYNILRRVVARWDYCTTAQPRAAITVYGGGLGTTTCNEILLQNCIVLDGNNGGGSTFTGGFSVPHETANVHRYGCISLNNRGYGFHSSEDGLSHDNTNTHCVVWDSDSGMWWRHLASGTSGAYNCTFEGTGPAGSSDAGRGSVYQCEAVDNIFINCSATNMTVSGNVTRNSSDFSYVVRSPATGKGATIEKKMGVTGTLYGEAGYNTLTNDNIWPWPYEDKIKELFSESNPPPVNVSPQTNDTARGFCASGQTLTKYIWEYLGNAIPAEIYGTPPDTTSPSAVSNLSVTSTTSSSAALSWSATGDDAGSGTAASYDIRYSTAAINDSNWASATQVSGEPSPAVSGTTQTMTVSGLSAATTYYFAMKVSDEVPNTSALSNVISGATSTPPDTTAPTAISNLNVTSTTVSSATLSWTSTGDDAGTGTAASYDIRYSTSTINASNWASATQVSGEPSPAVAGTTQTMTVSGLSAATAYYFAMKVSDEVPNTSALSNVIGGVTATPAPSDTTAPYTTGHAPAKFAVNIDPSTNIVVHVKDDGAGVDINTIIMKVNGVVVSPIITGTPADYTLTYDPSLDFTTGQVVNVTVDARDLAP